MATTEQALELAQDRADRLLDALASAERRIEHMTTCYPELLAALQDVVEELAIVWDDHGGEYDEGQQARMDYIITGAENIIAKATGGAA